jgi:cytochrome c oxidase subunit 1
MGILSLSLVRGLLFQVVGTLIGMAVVTVFRLITGRQPLWFGESAWFFGGVVGVIAFLYGAGVFRDWIRVVRGKEVFDHLEEPTGWRRYVSLSYDHKVIGIQYGFTSIAVIGIAGIFAMIFRSELASPGMQFLDVETFNTLMSMHGMVMIIGILIGVGAMSNYLVPLMIGANDMAFPRLNAFAYWVNVPGALLVFSALFLNGVDAGWTNYPPLSANLEKLGFQTFLLGVYVIGLSSITGGLNVIVTTLRLRAPGMSMFRMPIFVWGALAAAVIQLLATQLIALSFQLVMFQRILGMGFFDPLDGGNVLLYQHLFWFYSHPAVYVFVLPGLGVISEILPVFARKPLYGYRWVAMSSFGIALTGFLVWAHHMFTSGMAPYLRVPFMFTTLLVAIPTGVKFFSWVATLWGGKIIFPTPMLFTLGAISIFLLGGITGPPNATVATDLHLHDTYWVVGHFHATMFGGFIFPFVAAIYFWYPKMTGKMYNERLGKIHFWIMFPAFYLMALAQMESGLLGMRRRIADYSELLGVDALMIIITVAGFLIFFSMLLFVYNIAFSLRRGEVAERNPWGSRSPEWQLPSPPPTHNYKDNPFEVVGEPYDYGLAGSIYVDALPSAPPAVAAPSPAGD